MNSRPVITNLHTLRNPRDEVRVHGKYLYGKYNLSQTNKKERHNKAIT